jgi:LysR family transcriptional regulator, hydrogen peroxide-inducible genes activator
MHLNQITYFLAVCEELNFTRAAQRCGVSQPALTGCIKRLEIEVGGDLFTRKPTVEMTELGRLLQPKFAQISQEVAEALSAAQSLMATLV